MCALRNRQSFQNGPMLTIYSSTHRSPCVMSAVRHACHWVRQRGRARSDAASHWRHRVLWDTPFLDFEHLNGD
jgi:hypothetical protein